VPRIFVEPAAVRGGRVLIDGAAARHLSASLRARAGDTLVVVEAGRTEHGVVLDDVGRCWVGRHRLMVAEESMLWGAIFLDHLRHSEAGPAVLS